MHAPTTPQKAFTHELIASSALEILREEGPKAVSFRRLAERIGTSHVTVYRRCGSFEGLLDICADHVAADFPDLDCSLGAAAVTQAGFEAAYDMWATHADLVLLMRGRPWLGENIMSKFYEPCVRALVAAAMPIRDATRMFSVLHRMTIGSVILTQANDWNPWEAQDALARLGPERFPTLALAQREVEWSDTRQIFTETLRSLIELLGPKER